MVCGEWIEIDIESNSHARERRIMYPRCQKCGHVSRLWLHKLIPDLMTVCPTCKSRLTSTLASWLLLDAPATAAFCWALTVVHWPAWQAFLLLFGIRILQAPLRRFKVQ